MGVKGLTPLLRRFAPSSLTPISINDLQNKTLAIDGTLFIQRFVKGADRGENSHSFPHMLGFYQLVTFLKYYNIKPIFIFDGDANIRQKLQERIRRKSAMDKTKAQLGSENQRQTRLKEWEQIVESLKIKSKKDVLRSEYVTAGIKDLVEIVGDEGLDTKTSLRISKVVGMSVFMQRNPRFSPTLDDILIRTRVEKLVTSVLLDAKLLKYSKTRSRAQKLGQMEANLLNDVVLNKILDIPQQLKLSEETSLEDAHEHTDSSDSVISTEISPESAEPSSSVTDDQIRTPDSPTPDSPETVELSQPSPLADSTVIPESAQVLQTPTLESLEKAEPPEASYPTESVDISPPILSEPTLIEETQLPSSAESTASLPEVTKPTLTETIEQPQPSYLDESAEISPTTDSILEPVPTESVEETKPPQPQPLAEVGPADTLEPEDVDKDMETLDKIQPSQQLPSIPLDIPLPQEEIPFPVTSTEPDDEKPFEYPTTLIPEPPTSTELPAIALETKTLEEEETLDLKTIEAIISTYKQTIVLSDVRSTLLDVTSETDYYVTRLEKAVAPVTRIMIEEAKDFLRKAGVPCLTCHDHEAEAMCASLTTHGITDATVTEDMDAALFGEGLVIRQLQWKNQPMLEYSSVKAREELDLSKEAFLDLCIMCGTDFGGKVEKIGPVTALKLIRQYKSIENIVDNCSYRFDFPDNYLDEVRVTRQIFNKPPKVQDSGSVVYDTKPESPDLESFLELYDIQPSSANIFNDAPQAENKSLNDMVFI
ncbi:10090_t:CDS:1 [Paraglomus brasilianum]|uniref:10090_t:CDS:1 n=1 Tax=Paraglomus brasilianum TaxID=144538 RepID=A0A9N8ZAK2_9GLOM|nr:10090_t:CDS:1 [Paraglomus brasilianum]